jgi:hypothetical protein
VNYDEQIDKAYHEGDPQENGKQGGDKKQNPDDKQGKESQQSENKGQQQQGRPQKS